MRLFRALIILVFWSFLPGAASAEPLSILPLQDFTSTKQVSQYILRAEGYDGPIRRDAILNRLDEFESVAQEGNLRVASELNPSLFLLKIENATEHYREWVFTTRRHSINRLTIYDLTDPDPVILVDSRDPADNAENIRRYIGYGTLLQLQPGEQRLLAVYADLEIMRAIPIEIYGVDQYIDEYYWQTSRFAFILPSIFILIFINLLFFAFLGRSYFFFLAVSELCFLLLVMHSANYADAWGLAAYPVLSVQITELAKCGFIVFMSLFAINFLDTSSKYPILHRVLQILISLGTALLVFWLIAGWLGKDARVSIRSLTWIYATMGSFVFPVIGVLAVRRHGSHFIPLAIGWSAVAMVGVYIFAYATILPNLVLPGIVTLLAIIGLQEALFVTLSVIWKTWKDQAEQRQTVEAYAKGLEAQLKAVSHARQLEDENALATSTIQDQNALLQASGHDTRQVLLAINTATDYLEASASPQDEDLVDTLKASAAYLDDILSTTLAAKRTYAATRSGLALSGFSADNLLRALAQIYRPAFARQNLTFQTQATHDIYLVSDRALLMRALSNFVANALQATTSGGVSCHASVSAGTLKITIEDSGCGMNSDVLLALTADGEAPSATPELKERKGSGFRIAGSIIAQLHGELHVESEIGTGTKITLYLPCAHPRLTPVNLETFRTLAQFQVLDLDQDARVAAAGDPSQIGISFDDSSVMRARAAQQVRVLLYKPLIREFIDHPAIQALRSDQDPALSQ